MGARGCAPNADGQHLLIYRAEPGSDSARALDALRSLSAASLYSRCQPASSDSLGDAGELFLGRGQQVLAFAGAFVGQHGVAAGDESRGRRHPSFQLRTTLGHCRLGMGPARTQDGY